VPKRGGTRGRDVGQMTSLLATWSSDGSAASRKFAQASMRSTARYVHPGRPSAGLSCGQRSESGAASRSEAADVTAPHPRRKPCSPPNLQPSIESSDPVQLQGEPLTSWSPAEPTRAERTQRNDQAGRPRRSLGRELTTTKRASKRGPQLSAPGDERASVSGPLASVGGRFCTRPPSRVLLEEGWGADRSLPKETKGVDK
jgi:hypothetical protein